jgi:hypothetical protein
MSDDLELLKVYVEYESNSICRFDWPIQLGIRYRNVVDHDISPQCCKFTGKDTESPAGMTTGKKVQRAMVSDLQRFLLGGVVKAGYNPAAPKIPFADVS